MQELVQHPSLLRLADQLDLGLIRRGWRSHTLEPGVFIDRARRTTGLSDLGPADFEEGLAVLCRSAEEEAHLNLFGRVLLHGVISEALHHRLRRIALLQQRPEIFSRPLKDPVIVVGLPRSGTTHLHRLLALSDDARALKTWEVRGPLPGAGFDARRLKTRVLLNYIRWVAPSLESKHALGVDQAEECVFLMDESFQNLGYWMLFPVFGHLEWLQEQDPEPAYALYREYLQVFQAQTPDRRLVLKAPAHTGQLATLLEVIPEATIVQTHRDPVPVVGSVNSLFHTFHSLVSSSIDAPRTGRANLDLLSTMVDRAMATPEALSRGRVLPVDYEDLRAKGLETVRSISASTGLAINEQRIEGYLDTHRQHKLGAHTYSLEEAGLVDAQVRERFHRYRQAHSLP